MNNFNQSYCNNRVIEAIIVKDKDDLKEIYDKFLTGPAIVNLVEITSFEDVENKTYDIIISKGIRMPERLVNAFLAPDDIYVTMINNGYLSKYDQVMVSGYPGFVLVKQQDLCQKDIKKDDFKSILSYPMSAPKYPSPNPLSYQYSPAYMPMYSPQYTPAYNIPMQFYNPYMNGPYSGNINHPTLDPFNTDYKSSSYNSHNDHSSTEDDDWGE